MNWELTLQNTFLDFFNLSVTAGWIIVAVLILRAMLGRVPRKYVCILWFVVLFRLLCPITIETELSVVPQPTTITYQDIAYTTPKIETNSVVINTVADYTVNPVMEEYLAPNPQGSVNPMQVYLFIASALWVVGMIVLAGYTIISWIRMGLRLRESIPEVGYYRCSNIDTPFVFGLLKPKIYLPYGLEGEAKDYVLLHEQSHIARKDFLVKPLFWLAVMLHWMNPLVWVAWHYFSRDLELACDERAIDALDNNQKAEYSNTLLSLAIQPKVLHCPVAFGNNSVKQRITHVLHYKGIPALVRDIILILLVLVMILLAVNPLKAGTLSEFEPKLLEEYPYGLNSVNIRYGVVRTSISDHEVSAIHSPKAEAFRDWLANVKVQKVKTIETHEPFGADVSIDVSGVLDYSEEELNRHFHLDGCSIDVSNDLALIHREKGLRIKDPEAFREVILSYCLEELQNFPNTTFYADLNHDGKDELIIVDESVKWEDDNGQAEIAVYKQDGTLLFWDYLNYAHSGWGNYFLYEQDGKDYLLEFMPSMYQGVANYSWKLYQFNEKDKLVIAEEKSVEFNIHPEQHGFEIPRIYSFLTEVETMLSEATLLVSVENFELQYSTVNEPKTLSIDYYLDWLDTTWNGEANIGTSLGERLTNYQYSIYYDRPRQELINWLVGRKSMDITQQHLAGPQMITIDGIDCAVFDLRWNEVSTLPNGLIDRYAISTNNPENYDAVGNSRNYYLQNLQGEWIYLENSADSIDLHGIASQWADTYASRDGQGRYDLLSDALQKKVDKLDEYESLSEAPWLPYWLDNKDSLGLGNSSPWVQAMHVSSSVVVGGDENKYMATILYEMMDSAQGEYMYEETVTLSKENGAWKVADCYVSVNLLQKDMFELAEGTQANVNVGEEPWRLDPLLVASNFADDYLQITEGYWMEFDESKNVVLCHADTRDYTIYLYCPIQRYGETAFYAVSGYAYYETDSDGTEQLRHYHVGHDPWASLHIKATE